MSYLVLAYPEISRSDYEWIQSFRQENDVYYQVVNPHFTIVFPTFNKTEEEFQREIEERSIGIKKINFCIRCTVINKDSFNDYWHIFLTPDEGHSEIVKLHDHLYAGELLDSLLLEIPFVPHIGIGNSEDKWICKGLIDELNQSDMMITGKIKYLDIVSDDEDVVRTIKRIELC